MNGLNEDIDEDLDELDDEDIEDSLGERRRMRRSNIRGRGYNQPRLERSSVTQAQLQAAMSRVGEDIRKLATTTKGLEESVSRSLGKVRRDQQQFNQMAMLLPLLSRPKTVEIKTWKLKEGVVSDPPARADFELATTKVLSAEQDSMAMMLPILLMGGMGGSSGGGSGGGGNDMMMLAVAMIAMDRDKKS